MFLPDRFLPPLLVWFPTHSPGFSLHRCIRGKPVKGYNSFIFPHGGADQG
jgi:hypothetical protein